MKGTDTTCPSCGAAPGTPCKTLGGLPRRPHSKRMAQQPAPPQKPTVQFVHDDGPDVPEQGSAYMNCRQCLDELPQGQSPQQYKRLDVSITKTGGIQVWCVRHNCNVDTITVRIKEQQP